MSKSSKQIIHIETEYDQINLFQRQGNVKAKKEISFLIEKLNMLKKSFIEIMELFNYLVGAIRVFQ
jgi:hypothetical protein